MDLMRHDLDNDEAGDDEVDEGGDRGKDKHWHIEKRFGRDDEGYTASCSIVIHFRQSTDTNKSS